MSAIRNITSDGEESVFVVDENNVIHSRSVSLGIRNEYYAEIVSGLDEGELVASIGVNSLSDKMTIQPIVKDEENVSVFKCEEDEIVVRTKDIIYIEKCKSERQLSLHLQDEILRVKGNLNTMEENLLKKHFLRIHRAVLVNMRHIKRIRKAEVLLSNGEVVPVSRRKEVAIKEYFMKYAIMERNR